MTRQGERDSAPTIEVYDRRPRTREKETPGRVVIEEEPRVVLNNIDWEAYERIGDALSNRPNLRLTYDNGSLEIMTLSRQHEVLKRHLGHCVETIVVESGRNLAFGGSMTFKQEGKRGLEPDECYWIQNEAAIRGREDYDPDEHPPPDLVIEVEISQGAIPRMALFGSLGVPEVWRYTKGRLIIHLLTNRKTYRKSTKSRAFPEIAVRQIPRLVDRMNDAGFREGDRILRSWIRKQLAEDAE